MRVLIIEDEKRAAQRLVNLIGETDNNIKILDVLESVEESVNWLTENKQPDLLFLDIHLSDGLSFNIFNKVSITSPIIFTTAYDEYSLKAFELNSIDYLLKPIDKVKLERSLTKWKNFSKTSENQSHDLKLLLETIKLKDKVFKSRFLISKSDSFVIVTTGEIAYFYSEEKLSFLKTNNNIRHVLDTSLDIINDSLDPTKFFRINRQMIVSVNAIKSIHNYFNYKLKLDLTPHTENLNTVISRLKVSEFKEWIRNG
jgi:DNA-binding LytR/AlgR family response regulator